MDTVLDTLHTLVSIFFTRIIQSYYYPHFVDVVQGQILRIQSQTFLIPESMNFSQYCTIFHPIMTHRVLIFISCFINYHEEDYYDRIPNSSCNWTLKMFEGNSLAVQWLRLSVSTVGDMGSIPGRWTKILQAVQCGQKKKKKFEELTARCSSSPFLVPMRAASVLSW